jgi:hypothetical protein
MTEKIPYADPPDFTTETGVRLWLHRDLSKLAAKLDPTAQVFSSELPDGTRGLVIVENGSVVFEADNAPAIWDW